MTPRHALCHRSRRRPPGAPGRTAIAAAGLVVIGLTAGALVLVAAGPRPESGPPAAARVPSAALAASALRQWDQRRAAAWASGSVPALRSLYAAGAGAADVRLLRSYLDRGLRVHGLRMQLLALDVLARRPGEWRLRVTDRVARGVVVGAGTRRLLPRDQATTREVRLVRRSGAWVVLSVTA